MKALRVVIALAGFAGALVGLLHFFAGIGTFAELRAALEGGVEGPQPRSWQLPAVGRGALLSVSTTPLGATLLLDGKTIGTTPQDRIECQAGVHLVELDLLGYVPEFARLELSEGTGNAVHVELFKNSREGHEKRADHHRSLGATRLGYTTAAVVGAVMVGAWLVLMLFRLPNAGHGDHGGDVTRMIFAFPIIGLVVTALSGVLTRVLIGRFGMDPAPAIVAGIPVAVALAFLLLWFASGGDTDAISVLWSSKRDRS